MRTIYDCIIVGSGPAGIAAAISILERVPSARVLILEKGLPIHRRYCARSKGHNCRHCSPCRILSGVGGASGTLGGKLCFFPAGERVAALTGISCAQANLNVLHFLHRLDLHPVLPRHLQHTGLLPIGATAALKEYTATQHLLGAFELLFGALLQRAISLGATITTESELVALSSGAKEGRFLATVYDPTGFHRITASHALVWAGGRTGWDRLANCLGSAGLPVKCDSVDIGVRLRVPLATTAPLPPHLNDPKFTIRRGALDEVRTLCWTLGGALTFPSLSGNSIVDGHFGSTLTTEASVSIVARLPVPSGAMPLEAAYDQYQYARTGPPQSESLAAFMGLAGRHSKDTAFSPTLCSSPVHKAMRPKLRERLREMLAMLDRIFEGRLLRSSDATVTGPVLDKFWGTPTLDRHLMTPVEGLYIIGDATGRARGIVQAVFSGQVAGGAIAHTFYPSLEDNCAPGKATPTCRKAYNAV